MKNFTYVAMLVLINCFMLNGCSFSEEAPTSTLIPVIQATTSPQPTTALSTPYQIATTTMTSIPTLPPAEAEAQIIELLKNNGGCHLPCFWGFTPGQTERIAPIIEQLGVDRRMVIKREDLLLETLIIIGGDQSVQIKPLKWLEVHTKVYEKREKGINIIYGDPYYSKYFKYYTLPHLLSTYGPPENVYVFLDTGIADMGLGVDLYLLHLDYPKQGWVAHLQMPLKYRDNLLVGCPSEAFTNLRLWSPSDPARDYELTPSDLFTIEEATGMTIEEFYEKFKNPENTECLETPSDIHK